MKKQTTLNGWIITLIRQTFLIATFLLFINATDEKPVDSKMIEKSVAKISDKLYAGKYEVTNWFYKQFLNDLTIQNRSEDLKVAQVDTAAWGYEPMKSLYFQHPAYSQYPVVNISYEGAVLFCAWITEKYNRFPKRKFKEVKFFLPTEEQWMQAARGGLEGLAYSNGTTLLNPKGQPLANYARTDLPTDSTRSDSKNNEYLAPVGTYWENGFGIYNACGNAAEMISEKGITKGGSYLDHEDGLRLTAKGIYQKPKTTIGFRYFMLVVAE